MLIEWRPEASASLRKILNYISERNFLAAFNLSNDIEHAISSLTIQPYLHRIGKVTGTRELVVHPNYVVVY